MVLLVVLTPAPIVNKPVAVKVTVPVPPVIVPLVVIAPVLFTAILPLPVSEIPVMVKVLAVFARETLPLVLLVALKLVTALVAVLRTVPVELLVVSNPPVMTPLAPCVMEPPLAVKLTALLPALITPVTVMEAAPDVARVALPVTFTPETVPKSSVMLVGTVMESPEAFVTDKEVVPVKLALTLLISLLPLVRANVPVPRNNKLVVVNAADSLTPAPESKVNTSPEPVKVGEKAEPMVIKPELPSPMRMFAARTLAKKLVGIFKVELPPMLIVVVLVPSEKIKLEALLVPPVAPPICMLLGDPGKEKALAVKKISPEE